MNQSTGSATGGGGGGLPPVISIYLSGHRSVMYVDDDNTHTPFQKVCNNFFQVEKCVGVNSHIEASRHP